MIYLERDLNARQREAVTHGDSPLLVLAGPGTGKTRVITYRAAYLIDAGRAEPDELLVVTFTNKAANELLTRVTGLLGESIGGRMWVGTFHNTCTRILRDNAADLDLHEDFAIFDQETQDAILVECLRRAGLESDAAWIARLRNLISLRKVTQKDPLKGDETYFDEEGLDLTDAGLVARLEAAVAEYESRLAKYGAFDFDDLIAVAVERLTAHPHVLERYRSKFRHLLVDEYQDINDAQYAFLKLLSAPPHRITAVGDENQSIYSWRGSSPEWMRRFREEFQPTVIELEEHYRSTRTILHAAEELIARNAAGRSRPLRTDKAAGPPLHLYVLPDDEAADAHIGWLIGQLHEKAHVPYREIAVFYRNHRVADRLEEALAHRGIPIQRIRQTRQLLNEDEKRVTVWLRYLAFRLDTHLGDALTFPDTVLDEWTRVWFHWKALREERGFVDVLLDPGDDVPPLTRITLERTMRRMHALGDAIREERALEAVRRFFDELERHRSPFHGEDVAALPGWSAFPQLSDAADILAMALRRDESLAILVADEVDAIAAGTLLREMLRTYFGRDVPLATIGSADEGSPVTARLGLVVGEIGTPPEGVARAIWLNAPESALGSAICPRPPKGWPDVAAVVAHRLCQRLLALFELPRHADVVVYDIETTGAKPDRDEMIEFAATRLDTPEVHEHFYIRPRGSIPKFLTKVHGIDDATVKDKPPIEEQIPRIRDFFGDAILVGHNIIDFDNRFIERAMEEHLREIPKNPSYDTLVVARRLFPRENHQLSALADRFGIRYEQKHRAFHDVEATKAVFFRLREEEANRRADRSLPEYLPFVAIGAVARSVWEDETLRPYRNATARWLDAHEVVREVIGMLPTSCRVEARRALDLARRTTPDESDDERRWLQLKTRFLSRVQRFEEVGGGGSLRDFLNALALVDPLDEYDADRDAVSMMTLHSAKGTEYDVVIMAAMEEGILPAFRAANHPERLAEERRLCYVGMTRARERLYFVAARRREGRSRDVSSFVGEIPSNLIRRWSPKRRR